MISIIYDLDCVVIMISISLKDLVIKVEIDDWRLCDILYMVIVWECCF